MTIAISLKVHDGLVLASDSASTIVTTGEAPRASGVVNVYNNANKIFNLYKGLPIGGVTWGRGSIGCASIATLAKDLRRRFSGDDPDRGDWRLEPEKYTMAQVAERTHTFLFDEQYQPEYQHLKAGEKPAIGFLVAGYSPGQPLAEEWLIEIKEGVCPAAQMIRPQEECGASWYGQYEALSRLVHGHGTDLGPVLMELGVPPDHVTLLMDHIRARLTVPLVSEPMPIQDAIDLAQFFVHTTIMFSRFMPGAPTVGGPIEIAAITKHEGFKWVKRKHYYPAQLNPAIEEI